jgi:lantibiotic transport system ATP-binding protein
MDPIIATRNLNFSYHQNLQTLFDLNLRVPLRSIYCFLGPNGAGKTTTLRILLGLIRTRGQQVTIFNEDLHSNRVDILRRIGALIEQPSLYTHLTGVENLEVFRLSYRVDRKRIPQVLEITHLSDVGNQLVRKYSFGMKQRLAIAVTLLHDPELLILDEPTNGLDPAGIIEIRELIKLLQQEFGKTILVSSHLLSEVERIGTHFGIIAKGRLLFQGTTQSLQEMKSIGTVTEIEVSDVDRALMLLQHKLLVERTGNSVLRLPGVNKDQIPDLIKFLVRENINIYKAGTSESSIEDLFIKIVAT